jgi:hypothetical protein
MDLPIAIRKGVHSSTTKHPIAKYLSYQKISHKHKTFLSKISSQSKPRTIQEALSSLAWRLAVKEEMDALLKNGTWEVVNLLKDKTTVECKWVFTLKCKVDGSVEGYKARLEVKEFIQTFKIDYLETLAPVAKINSIRFMSFCP